MYGAVLILQINPDFNPNRREGEGGKIQHAYTMQNLVRTLI